MCVLRILAGPLPLPADRGRFCVSTMVGPDGFSLGLNLAFLVGRGRPDSLSSVAKIRLVGDDRELVPMRCCSSLALSTAASTRPAMLLILPKGFIICRGANMSSTPTEPSREPSERSWLSPSTSTLRIELETGHERGFEGASAASGLIVAPATCPICSMAEYGLPLVPYAALDGSVS